jgi:acetylornithine deacetylase/succinyl-diaminopimelate desuccinylase-like protein
VGPGSILDAHTDHEFVTLEDLETAVRLYAALAATLCPPTAPPSPSAPPARNP